MNKSGTLFFPFGQIHTVSADHSSSCGLHNGTLWDEGNAAGFKINFKECGKSLYHSGDTGILGDMALIDELYKPEILLLCIGGHYTMGPVIAAFSVTEFLKSAKNVVPMHLKTFPPLLPDTYPEFSDCLA